VVIPGHRAIACPVRLQHCRDGAGNLRIVGDAAAAVVLPSVQTRVAVNLQHTLAMWVLCLVFVVSWIVLHVCATPSIAPPTLTASKNPKSAIG